MPSWHYIWIAVFGAPLMILTSALRGHLPTKLSKVGVRRRGFRLSASSHGISTDGNWGASDGVAELTSGFVHHVRIQKEESPTSVVSVVDRVLDKRRRQNQDVTELTGSELLDLGSVWFLPASAPKDPALGTKPTRLTSSDRDLETGDYLRIHFQPRRFPVVHQYDWCAPTPAPGRTSNNGIGGKPGVIVAANEDKGWLVIDKPNHVPVHMTVDNSHENMAACIKNCRKADAGSSMMSDGNDIYVSTPQRLDQNTSGLVVVATSKPFAAYFASMLRNKTARQLTEHKDSASSSANLKGGIHKKYRCLVCIESKNSKANNSESVQEAVDFLQRQQRNGALIRHFLEPSIRAPKQFHNETDKDWAECLLRIANVGPVAPLVGSLSGQRLGEELWEDDSGEANRIPPRVQAVVEVEIELLTGRTHQIRGQMAALNFPLVGDAMYGGAVPMNPTDETFFYGTERLALQCCELEFRDPDIRGEKMVPSDRWNKVSIKTAWWTHLLEEYEASMKYEVADSHLSEQDTGVPAARPELLPEKVTLSPGKHKYVIIKATHPGDRKVQWFVKSAAPSECGGQYHGNVAQEPRAWIEAANYTAEVTGGGRINYEPDKRRACVYGFSYGFGRGDHIRAASIINKHLDGIEATYDLSEDLY